MKKKLIILGFLSAVLVAVFSIQNNNTSPDEITSITPTPSEKSAPSKPPRITQSETPKNQDQAPSISPTYPTWNDAILIDLRETITNNGLSTTRIRLVQPKDLPYQVRVEERSKTDPDTGRTYEELVSETVANHIIVGFKPNINKDQLTPILNTLQARLVPLGGLENQYSLVLSNVSMDSALNALEFIQTEAPNLLDYSELDNILHATATPNDRLYNAGNLWGLHNLGQSNGTQDADIDAPEAWDIRHDAPNIIVAVIDTGIRYTHEDLAGNMWINSGEIPNNGRDDDGNGVIDDIHGYNGINNNGDPMDKDGHGTHCAGTIGAVGNNGKGSVGVAWNVQLMACRFLGAEGGSTVDGIECINYARQNGAHVMSNSWGGGGASNALFNAIGAARQAGIVFVAAAGNDGQLLSSSNRQYPASYNQNNIVSVASHTRADQLSNFSNYGTTMVDIAAPGSSIVSTYYQSDTDYASLSGTSMATPHVSGMLALIKAEYPTDTYSELIDKLYAGVVRKNAYEGKVSTGGRANLEASLAITGNRPRLTQRLSDQVLIESDTLNLSVQATSNLPVTFSWKKNNSVIANATSPTLTIQNVTAQDSGNYSVVVTNQDGSIQDQSQVTILQSQLSLATALDAPATAFTTFGSSNWNVQSSDPKIGASNVSSGALGDESESTLLTRVAGPGEISFWWRVSSEKDYDYLIFRINGEVAQFISGETSWAQYSTTLSEEKNYTLSWTYRKDQSVFDGLDAGFVDGFSFSAEGDSPPTIITQPAEQTVSSGSNAIFEVIANGSEPLAYQWFKDNASITGQTQNTLTLSAVNESDEGSYSVSITNSFGSVTSNDARLTVESQVPTITTGPSAGIQDSGTEFSMTVIVTGTAPFSYQWQKNNINIPQATNAILSFQSLNESDSGVYRVNVSNTLLPAGIYSEEATLEVVDFTLLPRINKQPESVSISLGFPAQFNVEASGEGPLTYQWFKNGNTLSTQTQPSLDIANVQNTDAGTYAVVVSNPFGSVTSNAATLTLVSDLGRSVGADHLNWSNDGDAFWFSQSTVTHNDNLAAQSGDITNSQSTSISTRVDTAGIVSFWWSVSSEANWDFLTFYVDGSPIEFISGEQDWVEVKYTIESESGANLTWEYSKDSTRSSGSDAGWIDDFSLDPLTFSEAVDSYDYTWTQTDDAAWYPQVDTTFDSEDAVSSGSIGNNQRSSFQTQFTGKGFVTFNWKVSSEVDFDFLSFYVDNQKIESISGETDWQEQSVAIDTEGTHTLVWSYAKDQFTTEGSDAGYVDQISILQSTLPEALDNHEKTWTTRGDREWFAQRSTTTDSEDAAQSPNLADDELAIFETTVEGEVGIDFQWKVSSEEGFDFLAFYVDYETTSFITGEVDWKSESIRITEPGTHILTWAYIKDEGISNAQDTGWIDQVKITPLSELPPSFVEANHPILANTGTNVILNAATVNKMETAYQWSKDNTNLQNETNTTLLVPNVQQSDEATYAAAATNDNGSSSYGPITLTTTTTLTPATDAPDQGWVTSGHAFWTNQAITTHDNEDALQSGEAGDNEYSYAQTTVRGANTISFWWKVSSEDQFDFLELHIDGTQVASISGEQDWTQYQYDIETSGLHTIRWKYSKDGSTSEGRDAGWIDQFEVQSLYDATYESWLKEHFTSEQRTDPTITGENADPDQDGISNLVEYALLLDPQVSSTLPSFNIVRNSGRTYGEYQFTRRAPPTDIFYFIESSTDLTDWSPASNYNEQITPNPDGTQNIIGRVQISGTGNKPTFLRLGVSRF